MKLQGVIDSQSEEMIFQFVLKVGSAWNSP